MKYSKNYWVSWFEPRHHELKLDYPWWHTGWAWNPMNLERKKIKIITAAVKAQSPVAARQLIREAYKYPKGPMQYLFMRRMPAKWSPFNEKFPKEPHMQWD